MNVLTTYPGIQNYYLLIIALTTIIMKIFHDVFRFLRDKALEEKNKDYDKAAKYATLYHPFIFALMLVPFAAVFIFVYYIPREQIVNSFIFYIIGMLLMYPFMMNVGFNIGTKHNILYIGKSAITDKLIRKWFRLYSKGDNGYDYLYADEIQAMNFRKVIVFMIFAGFFILGISLIIDFT